MIAIPNMDKPKDCSECILADKHLNGLYEAKYYCRLEADTCPLIEIVRCGECKYQYMCGHQINRHGLTLKLTCCEYGERRAE